MLHILQVFSITSYACSTQTDHGLVDMIKSTWILLAIMNSVDDYFNQIHFTPQAFHTQHIYVLPAKEILYFSSSALVISVTYRRMMTFPVMDCYAILNPFDVLYLRLNFIPLITRHLTNTPTYIYETWTIIKAYKSNFKKNFKYWKYLGKMRSKI